jgi:putative flippase GtrA
VFARVVSDQRVRFLLAGAAGAALYYLLFSLGWLAFGARVPYPLLAVATGTACAALTYPLYRHLVFRASGPSLRGFWRFYAVCLWSLAVNLAGLSVLVETVGLPVLLAQALVVVGGPVVNYQISRVWAFRRRDACRAR